LALILFIELIAIAHKHQAILKFESQLQRGSIFILEMSMLNFNGEFICS